MAVDSNDNAYIMPCVQVPGWLIVLYIHGISLYSTIHVLHGFLFIIFVQPSSSTPSYALSKEQQLNDEQHNISTIYKCESPALSSHTKPDSTNTGAGTDTGTVTDTGAGTDRGSREGGRDEPVRDYSKYRKLEGPPREGDKLAFKVTSYNNSKAVNDLRCWRSNFDLMPLLHPSLQNEVQYCILVPETTPGLLWLSATKQRLAANKSSFAPSPKQNWNRQTTYVRVRLSSLGHTILPHKENMRLLQA